MNFPQYRHAENYDDQQKDRYIGLLKELGNDVLFDDDIWICDKRVRSASEHINFTHIYFSTVPCAYKELTKYYALIRLLNGDTVRTVRTRILGVVPFLQFIDEINSSRPISKCGIVTASQFKNHLDMSTLTENSKRNIWLSVSSLFKTMNGFDDVAYKNPFISNPYTKYAKLDVKHIPEPIADVLDDVFYRKEIDLHIRCVYWILRLIPSRVSEVLSMKIDCIKPYNGDLVIFIPTWKQNGGYAEPILRSIHIREVGISGYLINLIREQQRVSLELQEYLPEHRRGMLFTYRQVFHSDNGATHKIGRSIDVAQQSFIAYHLKRICRQYNVRDESGNIYNLTSHQFRHNGITDRLDAGFTLEQIADMTGHHGNAMIWNAYAHLDLNPKTIIEKQHYVLKEQTPAENKYVFFGGRILNMDEQLENRLLKNLRAHRVLGGICDDVTKCKSDMWNCLDCGHFIPDREQLPYFEEQIASWRDKAERFSSFPMIQSNSLKNAALFENIVNKIRMV